MLCSGSFSSPKCALLGHPSPDPTLLLHSSRLISGGVGYSYGDGLKPRRRVRGPCRWSHHRSHDHSRRAFAAGGYAARSAHCRSRKGARFARWRVIVSHSARVRFVRCYVCGCHSQGHSTRCEGPPRTFARQRWRFLRLRSGRSRLLSRN